LALLPDAGAELLPPDLPLLLVPPVELLHAAAASARAASNVAATPRRSANVRSTEPPGERWTAMPAVAGEDHEPERSSAESG
jgi:hypothetical protein